MTWQCTTRHGINQILPDYSGFRQNVVLQNHENSDHLVQTSMSCSHLLPDLNQSPPEVLGLHAVTVITHLTLNYELHHKYLL